MRETATSTNPKTLKNEARRAVDAYGLKDKLKGWLTKAFGQTKAAKMNPAFEASLTRVFAKGIKAKVQPQALLAAATEAGHSRRSAPEGHQWAKAARVLKRLTRWERISLNALAGTRPTTRDRFNNLVPMHPLSGAWLPKLASLKGGK